MKPIPPALLHIGRQQHGTVTSADLCACKVSEHQRRSWLDAGLINPVTRGVYRFGSHPATFEQRCTAAQLAVPDGVLSGRTGGRIHRLRKLWTEDVHLLAPTDRVLDIAVVHTTNLLDPSHITVRRGLRVLTPDRLLCDLARSLDDAALESVLEQMLQRKYFTMSHIRSLARRFRRPGRPGSVRLGRVLDGRPEWLRPVESDLELRVARALSRRGIELERQVPVTLPSGATIRIDLADPEQRVGIEIDHVTFHGGRLDSQRDKRRDRGLQAVGWRIVRVTDDDIRTWFDSTIDELVAILTRSGG